VLEKRYLRRNEIGEISENPDDMFRRVAKAVASIECKYDRQADVEAVIDDFYRLMASLEFLPNSPTLLNAGTGHGQLAGTMVLPIQDTLESVFDTVKYAALVHKGGSGIGFNFSSIRPRSDSVGDRQGVAFGPLGLLDILSRATLNIRQGGIRRGCNSAMLRVDHPDIMEFIQAKQDPSTFANFFTCIGLTDDFMERVKTEENYPLVHPVSGRTVGLLNAGFVLKKIADLSWKTGDPGVIFLDRVNRDNPTPQHGDLDHVSGCGEQPLLPNEFCHLGSINLSRMLFIDGDRAEIDFDKLGKVVRSAIRFLDNCIDLTRYPSPVMERATLRTRKVGLGIMGFADLLLQMRIPYDSTKALDVARRVMKYINREAHETSRELALERGLYPGYNDTGEPMRNATCTTIAPTGTISLIAGCTSGIEPAFAMAFIRNAFHGEHHLLDINPHFKDAFEQAGIFSCQLVQRLVHNNDLPLMPEVSEDLKGVFINAHTVSPEWHVRMQAAFQEHTDSAVSKTVNLPQHASQQDVLDILHLAYRLGLKGITVYRDCSRSNQPFCNGSVGDELVSGYFNSLRRIDHA